MADVPSAPGSAELSRIPFTVEAEKQINTLSFWLVVVGWLNLIAAVIDLLNLALPTRNIAHVFAAIIRIVVGTWALQAAKAFKNVATTDVADQAYLVQGFTKLRSIFLLQGVMILVGFAFLAAVLLFLLVAGVASR
jgi:hypothetical protein